MEGGAPCSPFRWGSTREESFPRGVLREAVDEVGAADGPVGPRHTRPAGLEVAVHLDQGRVAEWMGLDEVPVDVGGARPGPGADRGAVADRHRGFATGFENRADGFVEAVEECESVRAAG